MEKTLPVNGKFEHMALPYSPQALEPIVSANTLSFHHGKHLPAYVNTLNTLLPGSGLEGLPLEDVVCRAEGPLLNNAGQALNHNLYFAQLRAPRENNAPEGDLLQAINNAFGTFADFQAAFVKAGATLFGSGWAWLCADEAGHLSITQEPNAGNPLRRGLIPLMTMDVWEHAYYLDYQNRRPDHLNALWAVIDWDVVSTRYSNR